MNEGRPPLAYIVVQEPRANAQHLIREDGRGPAVSGTAEHTWPEDRNVPECRWGKRWSTEEMPTQYLIHVSCGRGPAVSGFAVYRHAWACENDDELWTESDLVAQSR